MSSKITAEMKNEMFCNMMHACVSRRRDLPGTATEQSFRVYSHSTGLFYDIRNWYEINDSAELHRFSEASWVMNWFLSH